MQMRRWVHQLRLLPPCLAVLAVAPPAAAQTVPAADISGGYSLVKVTRGLGINLEDVEQTLQGWYVEAARNETGLLTLMAQGGGNYQTVEGQHVKLHEFAAGVRSTRDRTIGRYVRQVLVGVTHFSPHVGYTNIESQPGGPPTPPFTSGAGDAGARRQVVPASPPIPFESSPKGLPPRRRGHPGPVRRGRPSFGG